MTDLPKGWKPDKSRMRVAATNRIITQSLFLEVDYGDLAYYTLKDDHFEYNGKLYPSLKKLFIEYDDPVEYEFANEYLTGWTQWQKIANNKACRNHVEQWREELEIKLRGRAVNDIIDMSNQEGSFQAAKFVADGGWNKRKAGRPSKQEIAREDNIRDKINDEYAQDAERMSKH